MIDIPAVCPTCGEVFRSGFGMGNGTAKFTNNKTGPCPNGHMGIVVDGTYEVLNGVLQLDDQLKLKIRQIAQSARDGIKSKQDAIQEISSLLPPDVAAIIQKYGKTNSLFVFLLILYFISQISTIAESVSKTYQNLSPPAQQPPPIVNILNHVTVINSDKIEEKAQHDISPRPIKREQLRRLRQMQHRNDKMCARKDIDPECSGQ